VFNIIYAHFKYYWIVLAQRTIINHDTIILNFCHSTYLTVTSSSSLVAYYNNIACVSSAIVSAVAFVFPLFSSARSINAPRVCPAPTYYLRLMPRRKTADGALYTPYSLSPRSHFEAYILYIHVDRVFMFN